MKTRKKKFEVGVWTQAGAVPVDSGQVMLCDPCYIKADFENEYGDKAGFNYAGACNVTLGEFRCGNFGDERCPVRGFATGTTHGDGLYPVFVKRDEHGRITSVRIDFDGDAEDEGGDE